MTGNVHDNCYPHIRLLPTHPHLTSADFVRLLPAATSAHPLIIHRPVVFSAFGVRCGRVKISFFPNFLGRCGVSSDRLDFGLSPNFGLRLIFLS